MRFNYKKHVLASIFQLDFFLKRCELHAEADFQIGIVGCYLRAAISLVLKYFIQIKKTNFIL